MGAGECGKECVWGQILPSYICALSKVPSEDKSLGHFIQRGPTATLHMVGSRRPPYLESCPSAPKV